MKEEIEKKFLAAMSECQQTLGDKASLDMIACWLDNQAGHLEINGSMHDVYDAAKILRLAAEGNNDEE